MMLQQRPAIGALAGRPRQLPFRAAPVACRRPSRSSHVAAKASLTVKEESTGVEFLLAQKFWEGEPFRCLGAAARSKKILLLNVKVYACAAYVEADRCAKELGVRERGGFFQADGDYCSAVMDGAFNKAIVIHLVRDIEGQQFTDAINDTLVPRMKLAGEMAKLEEFTAYFNGKKLSKDSEVLLYWNMAGDLEVLLTSPIAQPMEYDKLKPELRVRSIALCRGLFEIFMGENSVVPDARAAWVKGAKGLLESENVKRASRKA